MVFLNWFSNKPINIIIAYSQFVNSFFCGRAIFSELEVLMDTLTNQLSMLMKKKGLKGNTLAEATSVDPSTVSRILKGTQMPKADTLYKFAQFFDVTMEYLLTGNCTDATPSNLNNEEQLIEYYRTMNQDDKKELLVIAKIKADKIKEHPTTSSPSENDDLSSETA